MSEDSKRESVEEKEARRNRQIDDRKKELEQQDADHEEVFNNKAMISNIVDRQIDMAETLGEIKITLKNIDEHTTIMNTELGACKEDIKIAKEDIKDLKNKFVLKLSWKQMVTLIGSTGTLVTVIVTILHLVFHIV